MSTRSMLAHQWSRALLVTMVTSLISVGTLSAQRPEGRRGGPDREQLEQRVRAMMARMMTERLGLDATQAAELSDVVREFDGRRRELGRSEFATRRRVQALMIEGGGDEAEAERLLARIVELRRQEVALFEEEQAALRQVLTATQVLELQDLREQLGRRIRSLRGGDGEPSRRRRGGGDSGVERRSGVGATGWSHGPSPRGWGTGNVDVARGVGLSL